MAARRHVRRHAVCGTARHCQRDMFRSLSEFSEMTRVSANAKGETRFLYAGPYKSEARAEDSLQDSFADGDVSLGDRPAIVKRDNAWWVEVDG